MQHNTILTIKHRLTVLKNMLMRASLIGIALMSTPLVVMAKGESDSLEGATSCNFLPAGLCPANGDINSVIAGAANFLVGIFGAIFVLMIVIAGVQMTSAGDSPDRLKAAKSRLTNAIVGLVFLVLMRAILALLGIRI